MNKFIIYILIFIFALPTVAPMLPQQVIDVLHKQVEAHHEGEVSSDHHGGHVTVQGEDHAGHVDPASFYENLHVDLNKNPAQANLTASSSDGHDLPYIYILTANVFNGFSVPLSDRRSQGPPLNYKTASLVVPVYLATQRLRI